MIRIRLYQQVSECFGDTKVSQQMKKHHLTFGSPYAVAKASAFWLVNNYREAYGLFACTGLLFNHESSLRPSRFVTKKIIQELNELLMEVTRS